MDLLMHLSGYLKIEYLGVVTCKWHGFLRQVFN